MVMKEKRMQLSNNRAYTAIVVGYSFLAILLLSACGNHANRSLGNDTSNQVANKIDSSGAHKAAVNIGNNVNERQDVQEKSKGILDSSVNSISLSNSQSLTLAVGDLDSLVIWEDCECVIIYNTDKSQRFVLHHANGGAKNDFDIFTVSYSDKEERNKKSLVSRFSEFVTENNIRLGMDEEEFLKTYRGKDVKKKEVSSGTIYVFENGYETYLAEYSFVEGRLVSFRIGYDNS